MKKPLGLGVSPYPDGVDTATEFIEDGERYQEIEGVGLSKLQAVTRGRALLARMRGQGWRLRVWQNLGWHYQCSNGTLHVYVSLPSRGDALARYWTLMGYDSGGRTELTQPGCPNFTDPNAAVLAQVRFAREYIEMLQAQVDQLMVTTTELERAYAKRRPGRCAAAGGGGRAGGTRRAAVRARR